MLDVMKEKEKQMKKIKKNYEKENYNDFSIETELVKKKRKQEESTEKIFTY